MFEPPRAHNVPLAYNKVKNNWKYGAAQGIWKTPTFMVNGVEVVTSDPDRPGYDPEHYLGLLTAKQWFHVLDPIVQAAGGAPAATA